MDSKGLDVDVETMVKVINNQLSSWTSWSVGCCEHALPSTVACCEIDHQKDEESSYGARGAPHVLPFLGRRGGFMNG